MVPLRVRGDRSQSITTAAVEGRFFCGAPWTQRGAVTVGGDGVTDGFQISCVAAGGPRDEIREQALAGSKGAWGGRWRSLGTCKQLGDLHVSPPMGRGDSEPGRPRESDKQHAQHRENGQKRADGRRKRAWRNGAWGEGGRRAEGGRRRRADETERTSERGEPSDPRGARRPKRAQ